MSETPPPPRKRITPVRKALILLAICLVAISVWMIPSLLQIKDGRSRVEAEIAAMSVALESYKADNGRYPTDPSTTDLLRPDSTFDPELYIPASQFLYKALSGDPDGDPSTNNTDGTRVYFEFKPDMLRPSPPRRGTYVVDPFGNTYGYSTFRAAHPKREGGYNTTFDLWSTGGGKTDRDKEKWKTNW